MRVNIVRTVLYLNIAYFILTAAMTASLITSGAMTEVRPFSWREDWDVFVILGLLCTLNGLAVISSFLNQSRE